MKPETNCPICRKPVPGEAPDWPFCTERCRLLDLGNWASERYVIPSPITTEEQEDLSIDDERQD
jgi:hypothetical protein